MADITSSLRSRTSASSTTIPAPAPSPKDRPYDIIILGATGYTGRLACEYLLQNQNPTTSLRIALAGRSQDKLSTLHTELAKKFPDLESRTRAIDILPTPFTSESIDRLSRLTRVLATTVGPFSKYGEGVIEACARNGTHYVDSTGEYPWVKKMIDKYHEVGRESGSILIPQCAIESAVPDWVVYSLVRFMYDRFGVPVNNVKLTAQFKGGAPSGGTLETSMIMTECHTLRELYETGQPYSMSTIKGHAKEPPDVTVDKDLGALTPWLLGPGDRAIVMRSWSLFQGLFESGDATAGGHANKGGNPYGPEFMYKEYMRAPSYLVAWGIRIALSMIIMLTLLPPVKWLMRKVMTKPGDGPTEEVRLKSTVVYRAVGDIEDRQDEKKKKEGGKRALAVLDFKGDGYMLSGLCIAEAAITLALEDEETLARRLGGGILTPATLATEGHLKRIEKAGFVVNCRVVL